MLNFIETKLKVQSELSLELTGDIEAITRLKKQRNAVILAHNYMVPEVFHTVADITGDSLALADEASKTDTEVIVMAGVHFMAETAKILNPSRRVIIPSLKAGCSLAESISAEDVRNLRKKHPGVPVITYVNTSAEVKAESDICCTSGNALKIVESLNVPEVIMIPDEFLAQNIAAQTKTKIITWKGRCEVHEQFTVDYIRSLRSQYPHITVLAHPECPPNVIAESDCSGSTAQMIRFIEERRPSPVSLLTEISMSDNLAVQFPDIEFVRPCFACPHMKIITLKEIRKALEEMRYEIFISQEIAARARLAVEKMLSVK